MMRLGLALLAAVAACAMPTVARSTPPPGGDQILVMLRIPSPHFRPGASYGGGYGDSQTRSRMMRQARRIARDHKLMVVTDWMMPIVNLNCFVMRLSSGASAESKA
ncbi:MAG TPA: serine protease, partial [Sphingobium sp.]|nr:serine protease [Sphingobium sp.]